MATENASLEGKAAAPQHAAKKDTHATPPASDPKSRKKERKVVEVTNDLPDVWEHEDNVGATIEGFYVGPRVINYRGKPFLTHVIQDEDTGELKSFSGAIADRKMTRLPKGSWCRIRYDGKTRTSGGFDAKSYTLGTEDHIRLLDEAEALTIARELLSSAKSS